MFGRRRLNALLAAATFAATMVNAPGVRASTYVVNETGGCTTNGSVSVKVCAQAEYYVAGTFNDPWNGTSAFVNHSLRGATAVRLSSDATLVKLEYWASINSVRTCNGSASIHQDSPIQTVSYPTSGQNYWASVPWGGNPSNAGQYYQYWPAGGELMKVTARLTYTIRGTTYSLTRVVGFPSQNDLESSVPGC